MGAADCAGRAPGSRRHRTVLRGVGQWVNHGMPMCGTARRIAEILTAESRTRIVQIALVWETIPQRRGTGSRQSSRIAWIFIAEGLRSFC